MDVDLAGARSLTDTDSASDRIKLYAVWYQPAQFGKSRKILKAFQSSILRSLRVFAAIFPFTPFPTGHKKTALKRGRLGKIRDPAAV